MKIKIGQLRRIIKEEISRVLNENSPETPSTGNPFLDGREDPNMITNTWALFRDIKGLYEAMKDNSEVIGAFDEFLSKGGGNIEQFSRDFKDVSGVGAARMLLYKLLDLKKYGIAIGSFDEVGSFIDEYSEAFAQEPKIVGRNRAMADLVYPPGSIRD